MVVALAKLYLLPIISFASGYAMGVFVGLVRR